MPRGFNYSRGYFHIFNGRFEASMNVYELQKEWPIQEPCSLRPLTNGINNLTQVVETATGSYILRSYRSDRSLERIRYERSMLSVLQQKNCLFKFQQLFPLRPANCLPFCQEQLLQCLRACQVPFRKMTTLNKLMLPDKP